MDGVALLLMMLALALWAHAASSDLDTSDRLEWLLAGLMLNASAMATWNLAHGPAQMLAQWLPLATGAALVVPLLHLARHQRFGRAPSLQRFLPPVAFVAFALTATLAPPTALAAAEPVAAPAEIMPR